MSFSRFRSTWSVFCGFLLIATGSVLAGAQHGQPVQADVARPAATTPAAPVDDAAAAQTGTATAQPATASTQSDASDPLKRPLPEKKRKINERKLYKELGKTYQTWLDQDVRWIITDEEREAFLQLSNDEERDQFIEQFWLRRDPTPDTPENEFKEEHYRRIAYANEHFAAGIPGWRTDRGRIYIMYGPADEVDSHPTGGSYDRPMEEGGGSTSTFPFEQWRYRYLEGIGQDVNLEFVDTCMCNDYHLTMDRSEKDALLMVPGAGLTLYEQMGMSNKAERFNRNERIGSGPFGNRSGDDEFSRLELYAKMMKPPAVKFKDLEDVLVSHKITYNVLPFEVQADFVKVTSDTVLVPVTVQVKDKDITFTTKEGVAHGTINIFGRLTTLSGRIAQTFEDTVDVGVPAELLPKTLESNSVYWKAVPLRPGRYRLDLVVKDVNGDRVGTWSRSILVPEYSEDRLASSSLILADDMQKVPSKSVGAGSFVLGDTKVRPRVSDGANQPPVFDKKKFPKVNFWMQVYNLGIDGKTHKPSANFQYQIVNVAESGKPVLSVNESTEQMGNPGDQVTLEKSLPILGLAPGVYRITIKVADNVSKQTIEPTAQFTVR